MYNAATNCTERRIDGAAHDIGCALEICSEFMLRLASSTRCFAMPAPEYRCASPRQPQPWLYFQQHESLYSSFARSDDVNQEPRHDAVASRSLPDHPGIPNYAKAARAISAAL